MELTFNDFNKRSIRINNASHKFSFKCDSVTIFSFFIKGVSNFCSLESDIEFAIICFDTW